MKKEKKEKKKKRRFGDRWDGTLIRDLDGMHLIMPMMYPSRCASEAFINVRVDLAETKKYLHEKNLQKPEYRYSFFHLLVTAIARCLTLRPKMNRFIANKNMYQRNEVSLAFTIKQSLTDDSEEGLAFLHTKEDSTLESIREDMRVQIENCKKGGTDPSSEALNFFTKVPRFFTKAFVKVARWLDRRGKLPRSLIATDPYYSSCVISNLASVRVGSCYHHLTEWGTTSFFVTMGEMKKYAHFAADGTYEMRDCIDLGLTIDERIADGYYYGKTIRMLRTLLEHPWLLEEPLSAPIVVSPKKGENKPLEEAAATEIPQN
ncbi:MAG: hypothetical protein IKC37_05570 [Clostridia bacterium]|nr:hypothetical protein [Clostridia bacterium]